MKKSNLENFKNLLLTNYSRENLRRSKLVSKQISNLSVGWECEISERLSAGKPLLFGRLGGLEASYLGIFLDLRTGIRHPIRFAQSMVLKSRRQQQLYNNAGVFPVTEEMMSFFAKEHLDALEILDIFSVWAKPSAWVESNYISDREILIVTGDASYPWPESRDGLSEFGWGMAFDQKKVLVISPFIDSFEVQSKKFREIFQGIRFPHMELEYLRAPMSQGGLNDGSTYKTHLLDLKKQMSQKEFDIALISAGAYSLPLAAHAKKIGKIGIHAGGALQLFFGVTGQRYDSYSQVERFYNSSWKRPFEHERPLNWREIEDGCYW